MPFDEADAKGKLRRICLHCEILERRVMQPALMRQAFLRALDKTSETFENVLPRHPPLAERPSPRPASD